jgi:hypothetical protein
VPDSLAEAADELYALPPAEFRAARDERADQARAAGNRELAAAIRKLRRPTVSAWLVNRLVRDAGGQVGELLQLGEALQEAQSALAGDRLRELSERRRILVPALTRKARQLAAAAGQPVSDQAERELTGTLEAALADRETADAVRSGRLTRALSYAGLGGADAFAAVAAPGGTAGAAREETGEARGQAGGARGGRRERGRPAGRAGSGRAKAEPDRSAREAEAARRDLADAEAAAREAAGALAAAEQQAATTAGQHEAAVERVAGLERELDDAHSAELRASRAAREARRERDAAARSLQNAQRRLARARERASQHD